MATYHEDLVAIIGVGFKGPGAENLEELWRVLENGENHVVELPKERWNLEALFDPDTQALGKYYTRKAGLLSNSLSFDNSFFDINNLESDQMDPQQKLVLECSYRAMEHGGITRNTINGSNTGVYVGAMNCDFRGMFPVGASGVSNYTVTGTSNGIIAARVSYTFDLRGPCMVIDTGCSSSLIAIHTASQALRQRDCTMAFCGGVNFLASPDVFIHLSKARMVSPSGQCHAFSNQADGYTRGEGCGMIILKRLCDAQRDNNNILATIVTGTNQDGHTVTPISAPSKDQQVKLLQDMYRDFTLEQLDQLDYIEAHGTGTQAGDLAEAHALGQLFTEKGSCRKRTIGSIKTNIGHLESAAGVVGLIKVLLMMEHSAIVPSLFSERLNEKINFRKLNLAVATRVEQWTAEEKMACVNAFGFGGSNCHAIVRSYPMPHARDQQQIKLEDYYVIVCFSAKDDSSLKGSMNDFVNYLGVRSLNVHDIAYTSTCRRTHYKFRKALVSANLDDLIPKVEKIKTEQLENITFGNVKVIFVYGGMGTSWNGMCREFLARSDIFRRAVQDIDKCLKVYVYWSLYERLTNGEDTNDPLLPPLAIFACQVGLSQLWISLGVKPHCIVGQSVGEVAASYIAGHLSLSDAVKIIYKRSKLLSAVVGGKMFIVRNLSIDQVKKVVSSYHKNANVSLEYSPISCAVSCDDDNVDHIKNDLRHEAKVHNVLVTITDLPVHTAYHSHRMDTVALTLLNELDQINDAMSFYCPIISTVTGMTVQRTLDKHYWADNLRKPVRFFEAIKNAFHENRSNIFVEISPQPVLKAHIKDIFPSKDVQSIASMTKNSEWKQFLESLALLYCQGLDIEWKNLPQPGQHITHVPRYHFNTRKSFYVSEPAHLTLAGVNTLRHTHPYVYKINATESTVMISETTFPSIYEHKVSNMLIIPGAFYPEIGFALTKFHKSLIAPMYSVSAQFDQPFRISREGVTVLDIISSHYQKEERVAYKVMIRHENLTYATLELHPLSSKLISSNINVQYIRGQCPTHVNREEIYSLLQRYGFTYGPKFSLLQSAYRSDRQCLTEMLIPDSLLPELPGTTLHPSILDSMIQASVILAEVPENAIELLPKSIEKLTSFSGVEKKMYIVVTKRRKEGNLTFYDVTLTALDGHVIADMENLSHATLSNETNITDTLYSCIWIKLDTAYPYHKAEKPKAIFITDLTPPLTKDNEQSSCHYFDIMKKPWEIFDNNTFILNISFEYIIVLIANCTINDDEKADSILEKTENLCLFIQQLFIFAFTQRIQKPIFVFTKDAFTLDTDSSPTNKVSPIMTSMWGLFRCALHESIHDNIFAIDLHRSNDLLTLTLLASIADLIYADVNLKTYPEFLVTESNLYVNRIVKRDNHKKFPSFRLNHADNYLVLSNNPSDSNEIFCVHTKDNLRQSKYPVEVNVSEVALQSSHLYHINMKYSEITADSTSIENGYIMFATECRGHILIDEEYRKDIVACFPVPVATIVSVPVDVTVETGLLDGYVNGDLSKLTVLFGLCMKVKTKAVTILASESTSQLAECCGIILKTLNPSINVCIVQLEKIIPLKDTVLSIVYIDKNIISALTHCNANIHCFITVNKLIKDVENLFTFTFPFVNLDLLDPNQLFSRQQITKTIPRIKDWLINHSSESRLVFQFLHKQNSNTESEILDLGKLLVFKSYQLNNDYLRAYASDLFRKDSLYLVVGGLTGLGWLTVKYLATHGAGYIAILNRRSANGVQRDNISKLSSYCHIDVFQGDVSNLDTLERMFESFTVKFPNISVRGVFYGAAVLKDKHLRDMTRDDFHKVLLPKVKGAWNLHLLTKRIKLHYFVLYSSVASITGNSLQANYGAGNAFMDGLANRRRSMSLAGQSVNWGPLDLGLLEDNEAAKKNLQSRGFVIMPSHIINQLMEPILLLNETQIMTCIFVDDLSNRGFSVVPPPLRKRLETFFHWSEKEKIQVKEDANDISRDLSDDQRLATFEKYMITFASQILNIEETSLSRESNLADYGFDSIKAMTITTYIYRYFGVRLQVFQFLTGQVVVKEIAKSIDEVFQANI